MITAIVVDQCGQSHIRRYATDDPREARDRFVREWIDGGVIWNHFELYGPNCTVDVPAFAPDFLRGHGFDDEPAPLVKDNVTIYEWYCCTGPNGSDEHAVTGYFVREGQIT